MMGDRSWAAPPLIERPGAARRRAIRRRCLLLAAVVAGPVVLARPAGVILLPLVALGLPWGRLAHRSAGHGRTPSVVALARGAIHHRLDLIPVARIQSCRTSSWPLDRWRRLTTIHVDVAGSTDAPSLRDLGSPIADELLRSLPRRSGR
jgi:uncharacterized membrane protein YdbT with pleckstrin-like domain